MRVFEKRKLKANAGKSKVRRFGRKREPVRVRLESLISNTLYPYVSGL